MTLPEMPCPVPECLEPMVCQIFNCPNGHLICGDCRDQYGIRASATKEMVRRMTSLG